MAGPIRHTIICYLTNNSQYPQDHNQQMSKQAPRCLLSPISTFLPLLTLASPMDFRDNPGAGRKDT